MKLAKFVTWLCVGMISSMVSFANEPDSILRIPLLTANQQPEKKVARVEIKQIDFKPLQKTGVHFHPIPVVGYVAKGEIYFQVANKKPMMLHQGDAFFEPANTKIVAFDNRSRENNATFIAFYLLGKKEQELIKY